MAVEVEEKTVTRRRARLADRLMEGTPGRERLRISARAGEGVAIAIDLVPLEMTEDQMRSRSGAACDGLGQFHREQVGLRIPREDSLRPVRNVRGLQLSSVRRGDDQRQGARECTPRFDRRERSKPAALRPSNRRKPTTRSTQG